MPKGYANGMMAEGRVVVTGGVVGWDTQRRFSGRVPRPGQADAGQHRCHPRRGRGGAGASGSPDLVCRRRRGISRRSERPRARLPRGDRRALSGDGGGPGGPSGRKGRAGRDRGDRGGSTLTALSIFRASGRCDPHCDCKRRACEYRVAGNRLRALLAAALCQGRFAAPCLSELHQEQGPARPDWERRLTNSRWEVRHGTLRRSIHEERARRKRS